MAVKFLYYFVLVFVAVMGFLLYQKPFIIVENSNTQKEANIEMIDIINYSITENGVEHIVKASRALRYTDYDQFYDVSAVRKKEKDFLERLEANSGTFKQDKLKLVGNVKYRNDDNVKFSSQEGQYDMISKVFNTDVDFTLEDNSKITHGSSLVYQTNDGKIYATDIKSKIEVEEK